MNEEMRRLKELNFAMRLGELCGRGVANPLAQAMREQQPDRDREDQAYQDWADQEDTAHASGEREP